jgi:DNA-binding CsgD family transcriptional regulator
LRQRLLAELPRRQREVMSYVLDGQTTRQVAETLGLSTTTVLTYRYRAFAALGVRTHRELLALAHRGR